MMERTTTWYYANRRTGTVDKLGGVEGWDRVSLFWRGREIPRAEHFPTSREAADRLMVLLQRDVETERGRIRDAENRLATLNTWIGQMAKQEG